MFFISCDLGHARIISFLLHHKTVINHYLILSLLTLRLSLLFVLWTFKLFPSRTFATFIRHIIYNGIVISAIHHDSSNDHKSILISPDAMVFINLEADVSTISEFFLFPQIIIHLRRSLLILVFVRNTVCPFLKRSFIYY